MRTRRLATPVGVLAVLVVALGHAAAAQVLPAPGYDFTASTSSVLRDALRSRRPARIARAAAPRADDTPPPEITGTTPTIGFPKGLQYAFALNSAYQFGDTGNVDDNLPGGFDLTLVQRVEARTNVFFDYYQVDAQPLGVDTGSTPTYATGSSKPSGALPESLLHFGVNTKASVMVIGLQRLLFVGGAAINGGHPIVIAPAYASAKADIGGGYLNFQNQYNNGKVRYVQQGARQNYALNLVVPLSLTEKLNVLYFATGVVLVRPAGFNLTNHPQFEQQLLAQYRPNRQTTIFFEPSSAISYLPTDEYPIRSASFVYGISHRLARPGRSQFVPFVQGEVIQTTPTSVTEIGVTRVTAVPGTGVLATVGGIKFTTVQLSIGVGTAPIVIPYP